MNYAIKILDSKNNIVGELMTATPAQIVKLINKGMTVLDMHLGTVITTELLNLTPDNIGVSEGFINQQIGRAHV